MPETSPGKTQKFLQSMKLRELEKVEVKVSPRVSDLRQLEENNATDQNWDPNGKHVQRKPGK